jgi:Flp pilus assembly pilin Flp
MRSNKPTRSFLADRRGVYQVEYTIVLVLVAMAAAIALALLAAPLVEYHDAVVRIFDTPVL